MQLVHRCLQEPLPRGIGTTEIAHLGRTHLRIAGQLCPLKTLQLPFTRSLHTFANSFRILDVAFICQLLVIDAGDFNVDVNTVEQWTADTPLVTGDGSGRTIAFFDWVAIEAARTPVWVAVVNGPCKEAEHSSSAIQSEIRLFISILVE